MENKGKKFLAAIEKMQRDKKIFTSAIKEGKSFADMEKEGVRFMNVSK